MEVRVYFHNTNGLDNAYQSVQEATRDKPHIIGLVEVGAKQDQRPPPSSRISKNEDTGLGILAETISRTPLAYPTPTEACWSP